MIKLNIEDLSYTMDSTNGRWCDGGYGVPDTMDIFVDVRLSPEAMRRIALHEALELHLKGRVKHSKIDTIVFDVLGVLDELQRYAGTAQDAKPDD